MVSNSSDQHSASTEAVTTDGLEFTGERFTPECVREIWYEHIHRYALARNLCAGQNVLDAACGEGYGSNLLAEVASQVVGVDISQEAVTHAQGRYGDRSNLDFQQADCSALPFDDDRFDRIISFETLEHLEAQEEMLAEFRRVLKPEGVLVISSPDKAVYTDQTGNENPHHVRELYREEFESLLGRHFGAWRLLGQRLLFHSAIWSLDGSESVTFQQQSDEQILQSQHVAHAPMYFIALCAEDTAGLPAMDQQLWLFDDAQESVYRHYQGEIRKNMSAGGIIAERDHEIERLRSQLIARSAPQETPDGAPSSTGEAEDSWPDSSALRTWFGRWFRR